MKIKRQASGTAKSAQGLRQKLGFSREVDRPAVEKPKLGAPCETTEAYHNLPRKVDKMPKTKEMEVTEVKEAKEVKARRKSVILWFFLEATVFRPRFPSLSRETKKIQKDPVPKKRVRRLWNIRGRATVGLQAWS